ncbi:hypothetical protein [Pseudomonas aeruginosa]|uniref:hypothetical protein n=1 Tax=Pseudomonas aeruginosa TaxID=287 RepID=UPI003D27D683
MQLVLQPCSSNDAYDHYLNTIDRLVETSRILPYLDEDDRADFKRTFPEAVAVWGVTQGKKAVNEKKWHQMDVGDVALFYRKKEFFRRGTIAYKKRLPELARQLWETPPGEQPWEFVYFLTDLEPIQISILDYNQVAGYNPANIVQSFTVHYPELSARIIEELGLESSTGGVLTSVHDVEAAKEAFKHLGDELDVPAAVKRRKEQALLRTILLSNKASECCALCGRDLPVDLLVIGHIRKRHSCPPEMKKDLANVMPVCLLGCDRLFENGYVFIDSTGTIQQGPALKIVPSIQGVVSSLVGRKCLAWKEDAVPYFEWHRNHHHNYS